MCILQYKDRSLAGKGKQEVMDDVFYSALSDLVTGAGLSQLFSIAAREPSLGLVAAGAVLGVILVFVDRLRNSLKDIRSAFAITLCARQFFLLWEARDSDDGAGLVAIPAFFLICSTPVGNTSEYFRHARATSSALGISLFVASALYYFTTDSPNNSLVVFTDFHPAGAISSFLAVVDAAYATAQPPWQPSHPVWVALGRGVVFVLVSMAPGLARFVVAGPHPIWLTVLYSMVLVQSAQVHACHIRLQLDTKDTQRVLMLMVAGALSVGYSERINDVANVSFIALAVLIASSLALLLVQTKLAGRKK